jgi:hypothetical protein
MTFEISLQVQQSRLMCIKSKLHDVLVNPKNPKKVYYRVVHLENTGVEGTYEILYRRKIIYTAALQPPGFGHVFCGQRVPVYSRDGTMDHPAQATLFRARHMVSVRPDTMVPTKFIPTAEKKELPTFMLRDLTQNNLVEFFLHQKISDTALTTTSIYAGCENNYILLTLELYTDD